MAKINFDVSDESGEITRVVAGQADFIQMERKYDVSVNELQIAPRMEWISFVAWNACKRQGQTQQDFDSWLETVEFETVDEPIKKK